MILGSCEYKNCFSYATVEKIVNQKVTSLCEEHYMELIEVG